MNKTELTTAIQQADATVDRHRSHLERLASYLREMPDFPGDPRREETERTMARVQLALGHALRAYDAALDALLDFEEAERKAADQGKVISEPTVWEFTSTGEAYDVTQCDDRINDGDILLVKPEGVVGVLLKAWPCAVTPEHGSFHTLASEADHADIEGTDYTASFDMAMAIAHQQRNLPNGQPNPYR